MKKTEKNDKEKFIACTAGKKKFEVVNPLSDKVKIKNKKLDVKVVEDPDGFSYLVYNKKKYLVDIIEKSQNRYTIMINGVWYTFSVETPISYKRRKTLNKRAGISKLENINAPMPGKILDILVDDGADIKEGEPLIILEAMKMQNEIISHIAGKIKKINIKLNDSVMTSNTSDIVIPNVLICLGTILSWLIPGMVFNSRKKI